MGGIGIEIAWTGEYVQTPCHQQPNRNSNFLPVNTYTGGRAVILTSGDWRGLSILQFPSQSTVSFFKCSSTPFSNIPPRYSVVSNLKYFSWKNTLQVFPAGIFFKLYCKCFLPEYSVMSIYSRNIPLQVFPAGIFFILYCKCFLPEYSIILFPT